MAGKLYVVGVGPGDPELLTLKAVRVLKEVSCIIVPKGREEGSSLALSIVQKALALHGKEVIEAYFPMVKTVRSSPAPVPIEIGRGPGEFGVQSGEDQQELDTKWKQTVETVTGVLKRGIDAAFITIGDPALYSTFFYLYDGLLAIDPSMNIEMIPGISSINAAAARAGLSLGLGNERIAILPANYMDSLKETLEQFDTVVLMKVHKVFDAVRDALKEMNLTRHAVYIKQAGREDERIIRDIRQVQKEDLDYFSLVIVRK